jgi:tetratricopeptide (TPR) repeat protein
LHPLTERESAAVVDALVADSHLDAHTRARVVEAAGGNPLFAEQLASMLVEEGAREGARSVDLAIPPSIQALLAARLDRLAPREREVAEGASVVGLRFATGAVEHLVSEAARPQIDDLLASLVTKRFIEENPGAEDERFRFSHVLVKDAVYQGMLKRTRATLHERFVEWADRVNRDRERATEFEEILGYHLEQAFRYLAELGPLDEHGEALGRGATARLSAAGRRAFTRGDMPAAANLLRRAAELSPEDDPDRLALLPSLGEAFLEIGEFAWAEVYLEQARRADDPAVVAKARLLGALVAAYAGSGTDTTRGVIEAASKAIETFEERGDESGLATAYRLLAWAHGTACHFGQAAEAAEQAVAHARAAGDERQRTRAAASYAIAALHGPTPVAEAIEHCREILEQSGDDHRLNGLVTSLLAPLEAMRGDFDRARTHARTARTTLQELGARVLAASTSQETSVVEMLAGNPAEAVRQLQDDYDELTRMGERYLLSTIAGELARAHCLAGDLDAAFEMTRVAEELSAEDDIGSQALWRSVRARVLAHRDGDLTEAIRLASAAVGILSESDVLVRQADALLDLADILRLAGSPEPATKSLDEAAALLERKGNVVSLGHVSAAMATVAPA